MNLEEKLEAWAEKGYNPALFYNNLSKNGPWWLRLFTENERIEKHFKTLKEVDGKEESDA